MQRRRDGGSVVGQAGMLQRLLVRTSRCARHQTAARVRVLRRVRNPVRQALPVRKDHRHRQDAYHDKVGGPIA